MSSYTSVDTNLRSIKSSAVPCVQLAVMRMSSKASPDRTGKSALRVLPVGKDIDRQQSNSQASTSGSSEGDVFPYDLEDDEEKANVRRKTKILMDILTAGKDIDHVISQHINDIDEQMIELLDKRTKMASRMREGDAALGGLALVKRRLQAELEGKRATPSMRLLNALLEMMQPEPGIHIEEQEEEVSRMMRYAFQPPQMPHVDIFEVAAKVARGEEVADATLDDSGYVPQHAFIQETQQLSLQAARNLQDLERVVKRGNLGKYEAAYKHALETRLGALQRVQAILELAKQI